MRITAGGKFGALVVTALTLGACGGATARSTNPTTPPPTSATTSTTVAATTTTTTPLAPTIPTLPPTSATVPTTLPPTTLPPTTLPPTTPPPTLPPTTVPPTTVPASTIPATTAVPSTVPATHPGTTPTTAPHPATSAPHSTTTTPRTLPPPTAPGAPACQYGDLNVSLGSASGTAGTTYVDILFKNVGSAPCSLFGYPGVSYVRGSQGLQTGAPAVRDAAISGGHGPSPVRIAPGTTARAVLGEVDVQNFPAASCRPIATLGLRIYAPNQNLAFFVARNGTGCVSTSVAQLRVGFVVPQPIGP